MGVFNLIVRCARKLMLSVIGLVLGVVCSLLFYEFVISETEFNEEQKLLMFMGSAIFLSIGFAFSRRVRCISVLTIPEFSTRAGRRTIQATILILMLSGPMRNIADNGEETVRFLKCIKDMLLSILINGKDLVIAPIQHILFDLKSKTADGGDKYNTSRLREIMEPIYKEVEGDQDIYKDENDNIDDLMGLSERRSVEVEYHYKFLPTDTKDIQLEKNFRKKSSYKCEEVFSKGTLKCVELFKDKYDKCCDAVSKVLDWVICWPMKLTFICDILNSFAQDKVCDLSNVIEDGFGHKYAVAKAGIQDFRNNFKVHVNYQGLSEMINLKDFQSSRDELLMHYLRGRKYVEWYLTIIKRGLALSYFFVVYGAFEYHGKYFSSLSADNIYITPYFRKIDGRREASEKETLLPLKSFEVPNFSRLNRIQLTESEWKKFGDQLFAILIQAGVVFTIFGFDFLYKELLHLVQNHADIHIRQQGQHVLAIQVKGEGLLAQLLRVVINDFSINQHLNISHLTKPCLPVPKETPKAYYQRVVLLFLILLINSYFQAHSIRFRHCVANYFYQKVSRNPLVWLADFFPNQCRCLKWWKVARRKCVVCKRNGEVFRCPDCGYSYCQECYQDLVHGRRCLYCLAQEEIEAKRIELEELYDDEYAIV